MVWIEVNIRDFLLHIAVDAVDRLLNMESPTEQVEPEVNLF